MYKILAQFRTEGPDEELETIEKPSVGKQRVLKELQKVKRSKKIQNTAWYYIRHKGEYVSFKKHEEALNGNLTEMSLRKRDLPSVEPDPNSQFIAASDQLNLLYSANLTGAEVRAEVVAYLRDKAHWDLLLTTEHDLLEMTGIDQTTYCDEMEKPTTWGDFITLQAIVQKYQIEINVVTSVLEPKIVQFPVIPERLIPQKIGSAVRTRTVKDLKASLPADAAKERYLLIGADGGKVLVDKFIAEQSSVLAKNIVEAKERGTNKIRFAGLMTGKVLRSIVEQLEAHYLIKHNDRNPEVQEAYRQLGLVGKFGDEVGEKQIDPPIMLMAHYWGYHWGSLEKGNQKIAPSDLPEEEKESSIVTTHNTRIFLNRVVLILIIISGFWWLLWLVVWGHNYNSFFEGVEFTFFWVAEFINYALGTVYNFNFWKPIQRRWKSLDRLNPPFQEKLIANVLISHYSEAPSDTERTINGSLRMRTTEDTTLRVWICDDGFWKYPPPPKAPPKAPAPKTAFPAFIDKIKANIPFLKGSGGGPAMILDEGEKKKKDEEDAAALKKKMEEEQKKKEAANNNNVNQEEKKEERIKIDGFTATFPEEDDLMQKIARHYGATPKPLGLQMVQMIRRALYRYYSERVLDRVDIGCDMQLRMEDEIVRADCAKGTLRYTFYAKKFGTEDRISGPIVILAARIKPDYHHYKAGNHNNILFNEKMEGEFILFLDNDMKPKPDFLMRTLPFFYYYDEGTSKYEINKSMSFIQSPQFFKQSTIAGEADTLGGRNSVFFQGIQHGRDGYDMAAFAGTNAIFRLPPIHTVGGVPYGSLTEDAHTSIKLHKFGYKSFYVPDKLAVGIAPVTVANSLQQRGRWCKGSVQLSFLYLFGFKIKDKDKAKWTKPNPFNLETRREVGYFANYSFEQQAQRNMFRKFFLFDTMSWPFSAITAVMYIVVAFIFLIAAKAPIYFLRDKLLYRAFLVTFLPYFTLKLIFAYLSYHNVNAQDVWVAQEIWFSYAFASIYGIVDALKELITGKGLGGWGVTGEGTRSSNLEYFNVIVVFSLILLMGIRAVLFFVSSTKDPVEMASIFFAATIVIQMWPVTSTSVYEWINNAHLTPEDKVDLKRYVIPKYLIFAGFIIATILIGQLMGLST